MLFKICIDNIYIYAVKSYNKISGGRRWKNKKKWREMTLVFEYWLEIDRIQIYTSSKRLHTQQMK